MPPTATPTHSPVVRTPPPLLLPAAWGDGDDAAPSMALPFPPACGVRVRVLVLILVIVHSTTLPKEVGSTLGLGVDGPDGNAHAVALTLGVPVAEAAAPSSVNANPSRMVQLKSAFNALADSRLTHQSRVAVVIARRGGQTKGIH